ncbi:MAG TPA: hypothetical protein VFQ45_02000 [Longimicrobium sp.]|nr:hypothetical protein [Longimicrobium sp.]
MSDQDKPLGTMAENVTTSAEPGTDKLVAAPAYAAGAASEVAGVEKLKHSHPDPDEEAAEEAAK